MEFVQKLRSAVYTVQSSVTSALPGNPVTREYVAGNHVASAGPGLVWKIYSGHKKSTQQEVSVWVFDKKSIEKWPKNDRDLLQECLKKGVNQLTRLRHPRLLTVQHPLEESRDTYAFATEPIFCSVANALGRIDNMPAFVPAELTELQFGDVEIRHGFLQPAFPQLEWQSDVCALCQPSLDYLAPEHVLGGRVDPAADMFSLGVLAYAVFNKGRTLMDNGGNLATFKKNATELKTLPVNTLRSIPEEFREYVKMCVNFTPDLRPDATQFSKIPYFDNVGVKTLNYLESLCQCTNLQKSEFLKELPKVLSSLPKRMQLRKVLPALAAECTTKEMVPFVLPSVFLVAEAATNAEYVAFILPHLIPVFSMREPVQIMLSLLQKMELLLSKTPPEEIKKHLLPLVYGALESAHVKAQEMVMEIIPGIAHLVDAQATKTHLLPRLMAVVTDGRVGTVKVNALLCLSKLLNHLEPWMITDQILPALPKINSREPGVLMACLGIYQMAFGMKQSISKDLLAKNALPFLIAMSVEQTLNESQFESFMALIRKMLDKVEKDQRQKVQQLSALEERQRGAPDFSSIINKKTDPANDTTDNSVSSLGKKPDTKSKSGTSMSLEEKQRIAREQEQTLRLRSQAPLKPKTTTPSMPGIGPPPAPSSHVTSTKDLTSTLTSNAGMTAVRTPIQQSSMAATATSNVMQPTGNRTSMPLMPQQQPQNATNLFGQLALTGPGHVTPFSQSAGTTGYGMPSSQSNPSFNPYSSAPMTNSNSMAGVGWGTSSLASPAQPGVGFGGWASAPAPRPQSSNMSSVNTPFGTPLIQGGNAGVDLSAFDSLSSGISDYKKNIGKSKNLMS